MNHIRNENQHLLEKFQDGVLSYQNTSQNSTNKRKSFEIFLKERYSDVAAKYTFLSSQQIKKRILDMWKKMPHSSNNPRKVEETPKNNKRQYSKKETSFNNKHSAGEPKSAGQPLRSKVLVPLKVDVLPAPLKGVLKSEKKKKVDNKRVSFDCDPEIRYRTASETSSNSTLKSIKSQKEADNNGLYFNPQTAKKQYSAEMLMATKNNKPKSEAEKKFDDLINKNCSWTYKSIKTVQCRTREENDGNGHTLEVQTMNIEETAFNQKSHQNNSTYLLNEYDNIEEDTKKKPNNSTKKKKLPTKSRHTKIVKLDSIEANRNGSRSKAILDTNKQKSSRNKRNIIPVSYAESDLESNQSSSDDGLVFLSRGCDEIIVNGNQCDSDDNYSDKIEIPQEEIANICAVDSNYDAHDTNESGTSQESSFENCTEMNNRNATNYQNFKPHSYDETENSFYEEENKTGFQDQNDVLDLVFGDDHQKSNFNLNSIVNRIPEKETDLPSSETLSSLSEWDSIKFEKEKEKSKPPKERKYEDVSSKNDLDSEIIQQYKTISTEVQSVCNELETPNDDEFFNDFFNGNFNLDKYKSKFDADESASTKKEEEENGYKSKLLNEIELDDSPNIHSYGHTHSNEKVKKNINRMSDKAKDTKAKRQKADNNSNYKDKDGSKVRSPTRIKGKSFSYFDDNYTPSVQSDKDEAVNDEVEENEYPVTDDYFKENSSDSPEKNNKFNKNKQNNSVDSTLAVKRNSKNKDAFNVRSSKSIKDNRNSYFDDDYTPSEQSGKEAGNDEVEENEYPIINDNFKGTLLNNTEKNRTLNKTKQKRNNSAEQKDISLDTIITNKSQCLDKKDLKLRFPNKYDAKKQPTNSKPKTKGNVSLSNTTVGSSAKYAKKTPKTWEDLEADLLNREEQISFMPLFEAELSSIGEEILNEGRIHHIDVKENRSILIKPVDNYEAQNKKTENKWGHIDVKQNICIVNRPVDNFETQRKKTDNKWGIVKSEQGNSGHLACRKSMNEVTFDSPNAGIIDRVIRRMQMCTSPVLTPNKGLPQLKEHQKSPILKEYSYSVHETKSVFLTKMSVNEKQTGKLKTAWKNTKQKNYRLCKKREIKTIIDSKGASITNQTSVKLNEIPKEKSERLSKNSESDNESIPASNKISEKEFLTSELEKDFSSPQDLLVSVVDEPYNFRKRKCKDNAVEQNTTKKVSIIRENSMNKSNTTTKSKSNKTFKQGKQDAVSIIENPKREDINFENYTLLNKKKKYNKMNFMNGSTNNVDESKPDSSQNGTSSTGTISHQQDGYLEKSIGNLKTLSISNEETHAHLASGNTEKPDLSLRKQAHEAKKSIKANRPKRKLPKRVAKEEYEKYLQDIFCKDITVDSNTQWEFQNGRNETSGKNLLGKDNKSCSSIQKALTENSDEELFSLSSDTDYEEPPSQRRASGLLDDVFT